MGPIMARFAPRVMVAQGAPPDDSGSVNLSLHVGGTRDELLRAGRDPERLLIMEVNPHLPRTKSLPPTYDNTIPLDAIDVLVESDGAPFALADPPSEDAGGRGHRAPRTDLRAGRVHTADGHRRHSQHRGGRTGAWAARRVRHPFGDVHHGSHAAAPGREGHQRRQGDVRRRVGDHLRAGRRPSSTNGSTGTTRSRSSPSTRSTTRR